MNWEEVTEELEAATERLMIIVDSDFMDVSEALNQRAAVIGRLHGLSRSQPEPIPGELLERIRRDFRNGAEAQEKLLLKRADMRGELTRMAESSYLMRSLSRPKVRTHARLDCTV